LFQIYSVSLGFPADPPEESDEAKELVALGIAIEAFEKRVFVI